MKGFVDAVERIITVMRMIAGIALTFIILLTVADVVLRAFGRPILGTYEIVGVAGGVVIGFVTPFTSWVRGHIFMDFVLDKLPPRGKKAFEVVTRCVGTCLFLMISWNMMKIARNLYSAGEVSPTLEVPILSDSVRGRVLLLHAFRSTVLRYPQSCGGQFRRRP